MYVNEQKTKTVVKSTLVAIICDKCGTRIENPDSGYHKYISYTGYPRSGYPDDWSASFQLCPECSNQLLEVYLKSFEED